MNARRLPHSFLILATLSLTTVFFQNCSVVNFDNGSSGSEQPKLGGGGIDGKMYYSYGNCVPQTIDVVSAMVVQDDKQKAWTVREDCRQLPAPKAIDAMKIKIASDDSKTVMFDGRVFTQNPFSDGMTNSPVTVVQKPALLSTYPLRPVWSVAGVDYPVGAPAATVLKDPATIALAGVTVNTAAHHIIVTANNVTLDGYDFSLNGGWSVRINGASNTRIVNSLFVETASQTQAPIMTDTGASDLYVGYTTIDGGGTTASPAIGGLIVMNGRGLVTEYCWLKNAPSNIFVFGSSGTGGGGSALIQYNLVENSGRKSGGGGTYLTINSGSYDHFRVVFNTSFQTPGGTGAMGWNMDAPFIQTAEVGNNTMISSGAGAAAYLISAGQNAGAAVLHDNYFDLSGAFGFAYPGTSAWATYSDNYDLQTGQALPNDP